MIQYIKKQLAIFTIIFILFGLSFYLYQSQDTDINSLRDKSVSLKSSINKAKNELRKMEKELVKNQQFFENHPNLYIIDKPETLDPYRFEEKLSKDIYLLFGNGIKIKFNDKFKKIKNTDYVYYNTIITFPYKNRIQLRKFFYYLNNNYLYNFNSLKYDSKNNAFILDIDFIGKNGKSIFKSKRTRRRR